MLELLEYLVLGIGVGTVGALLGLGGGFILVPIFMLFMIAPHGSTFTTVQQVVGTSLFAVFCNAISGTLPTFANDAFLCERLYRLHWPPCPAHFWAVICPNGSPAPAFRSPSAS